MMSIIYNLVKYKIFGTLSLFLGSLYLIINSSNELTKLQNYLWAIIILVLALIQSYDNFILMWTEPAKPKEIKKENKKENEPLIREEFPVIKQRTKEMKSLNSELKVLKGGQKKELFFEFRNEVNDMLNNLEIKNKI